jgi:hypothetical protein
MGKRVRKLTRRNKIMTKSKSKGKRGVFIKRKKIMNKAKRGVFIKRKKTIKKSNKLRKKRTQQNYHMGGSNPKSSNPRVDEPRGPYASGRLPLTEGMENPKPRQAWSKDSGDTWDEDAYIRAQMRATWVAQGMKSGSSKPIPRGL